MQWKNSDNAYGVLSKTIHWLMALCILGMFVGGVVMHGMEKSPLKWQLYAFHKSMGLSLLILVFVRIIWHIFSPTPSLGQIKKPVIRKGAKAGHRTLYFFMLLLPISGWIMSCASGYIPNFWGVMQWSLPISKNKTLSSIFHWMHMNMAWLFMAIVAVHITMALWHHYYYKDSTLVRMLPGLEKRH